MKLLNKDLNVGSIKNINLKKKNGKPFLTTEITSRDKKLLAVAGVILIVILSFFIVYKPLSAKIADLKIEKQAVDAKVTEAKEDMANETNINKRYESALKNANDVSAIFFPKVYPYKDRYVLMLEKVVKASGATAQSIKFDDPEVNGVSLTEDNSLILPNYYLADLADKINSINKTPAEQENQDVKTGNPADKTKKKTDSKTLPNDAVLRIPANLVLQGNYAQIRAAIRSMENLNRAVAIEGITINKKDAEITASFILSFYAVEKVDSSADPFNVWALKGAYGKTDLFN